MCAKRRDVLVIRAGDLFSAHKPRDDFKADRLISRHPLQCVGHVPERDLARDEPMAVSCYCLRTGVPPFYTQRHIAPEMPPTTVEMNMQRHNSLPSKRVLT